MRWLTLRVIVVSVLVLLGLYCCHVIQSVYGHKAPPTQTEYNVLYGGVVGQEIFNVTLQQPDIAQAIQVALDVTGLALKMCAIKLLTKQRLLRSIDGTKPLIVYKEILSERNIAFQKKQIVIGTQYRFVLIENCTDITQRNCLFSHQFHLTRDINMEFFVFRHTTMAVSKLIEPTCLYKSTIKMSSCRSMDRNIDYFKDAFLMCPSVTTDGISTAIPPLSSQRSPLFLDNSKDFQGNVSPANSNCDLRRIIRLATYNIWNLNGLTNVESYEDRLQRIGKLLTSLMFDIYGFQEVRFQVSSSKSSKAKQLFAQSQVSHLASILADYQFVYQPAMLYMESVSKDRNEEGLAIFSKYPIVSSDYILLHRNKTDNSDTHQRICLHAEILTPLTNIHVFVTHFSLSQSAQERSILEIWKYMEQFTGIKILMGDLNTEPDSNVIRFMSDKVTLGGLRAKGWKDLWTEDDSNKKLEGHTFSALEDEPIKRIDYLFMGQPQPPIVKVVSTQLFGNQHECYVPCSDHLGLVTSLRLL